jgi:hypothetical protein
MIQIIKYLVAFFLGCLFMAHNPTLSGKVIGVSEQLRDKIVQLTGKASREAETAKTNAENAEKAKKAAAERKRQEENGEE